MRVFEARRQLVALAARRLWKTSQFCSRADDASLLRALPHKCFLWFQGHPAKSCLAPAYDNAQERNTDAARFTGLLDIPLTITPAVDGSAPS